MTFNETDFIKGPCSAEPVKEYQLSEEEKTSEQYMTLDGEIIT